MEVFEGTVRIAGDPEALPAELVVAGNRLTVSARQQEIGDWLLSDVSCSLEPDGCHVVVEGEELVVSVPELLEFAAAIGPHVDNPGDGSLRELEPRQDDEADSPDPPDAAVGRISFPRMVQLGAGAVLVTIGLAIWAPVVLVGLILLAALGSLLVGGFALLDPYLAVRMPDPFNPSLLFRAGVAGSIVALGLAVIL